MTGAQALLREVSVSRLAGTPAHARVREALKRELAARGFVVMEQRFTARPRWPLWGRAPAEAVNLIAVRPRARVTAWLAAHYDSKGQAVSMATRLVLVAAFSVCVVAAVAALLAGGPAFLLAVPAVLAALVWTLSRVVGASPGAVDNGSGVLTVLGTVDALPPDAAVGVLFLDAEEFGLCGASALTRQRANLLTGTALVNFDGVDDRGRTIAFVHRGGPLVDRLVRSLDARRARWLPVVVDGLVLARAARECVTIMRGDWETARAVHTERDTPERLTLSGSRDVARAVAAALLGVRGPDPAMDASPSSAGPGVR